jgi:lipopolysaccharide export system protein LptA
MTPAHTQRGASKIGLIVALVVGVGFASMLAWFVFTDSGPSDVLASDDFVDVPSITDILGDTESGGGLNLQFADKDDPSRVSATLEADSFRPAQTDGIVEPSLFELEKIHAKFFLKSGETLLIESDTGQFFMPDRRAGPEKGSLSGSPKITLFSKDDPDGEPVLVADFDETLRFDFTYSHIETPGRLHVVGNGIEFAGYHLTARLNEQQERIDVLEVERGEYIKYHPKAAQTRKTTRAAPNGAGNAQARARRSGKSPAAAAGLATDGSMVPVLFVQEDAKPTPVAADEPHLAYYLATFRDSVELAQGSRRVTADVLESWVRLIDHKIPDRTRNRRGSSAALSPVEALVAGLLAQVETGGDGPESATPPSTSADEPQSDAGLFASSSGDEPIVLTWTGPLRVVPLVKGEPKPLARDDASFRFTAVDSGLVRFFDDGASGQAAVAEYAATRETLTLTGTGGSVVLEADDQGWIEASKTVVRLGSGEVTVVGPGTVNQGVPGARGADRSNKFVRWMDQADFSFLLKDGRMTGDIGAASFAGDARAVDGERRVDGDMLVANFMDDGEGHRVISQVEAYAVEATDGHGATMFGERVVIPFRVVGPRKTEPSQVYASGGVVVERDGKRIETESLSATLTNDKDGKLTVSDMIAERGARFVDGDEIEATGERIEANGLDQIAVLIGTEDEPARVDYGDSIIIGPRIDMAQDPQLGGVTGPGSFEQEREGGKVRATWQESMSFDRSFGVLECLGDAKVTQTLADGEIRSASGDQLTVEFIDRNGEFVFDAASVFGTNENPAVVESRRAMAGADATESLMHLESSEILSTGGGDGLIVPRPGRLIVLDHRADAGGDLDGWDRGTALMTWKESLVVDRALGTARFAGDAQMIHKTLDDGRTAEIAADLIVGHFVETPGAGVEFTRLDATGTAYFRMEDKEILAAVLRFDTENKVVHALAGEGEPIRFIDNATGSVMTARSLEWNLATDRIVIDEPSPLTLPRGN